MNAGGRGTGPALNERRQAGRVPSEKDDLLCAEALGRNDATQTDCAVTDYGCFLATAHLCDDGGVMAGSHDV